MALKIPSGDIELQAHLREPEKELRGGVILCHPHPLYGGTMDNRVVYRAAKAAAGVGFAALRFNFRGVAQSSGQYDHGLEEQEDVAAAIDWIEKRYPKKPIVVLGYSFGAWVGLQVGCRDKRICALIGIGLPLDLYDFACLVDYSNPALYIVGTRDEFCSEGSLDAFASRLLPTSRIERMQNADHFFSGQIEKLEELIEKFFEGLPCDRAVP